MDVTTKTSPSTISTTPASKSLLSQNDVYVIIAMSVISAALVIVIVVLLVHSKYCRKSGDATRGADATPGSFYRQQSVIGNYRSSSRSTNPLHDSMMKAVDFHPRLAALRESSNTYLPGIDICPSTIGGDSMTSSVFRYGPNDIAMISDGTLTREQYYAPDLTQSYPDLQLCAQAPFSPYHLTWITPNEMHRSATAVAAATANDNVCNSDDIRRTAALIATTSKTAHPNIAISRSKSPYHPNYNTPTGHGDGEVFTVPDNAFINEACSFASPTPNRRKTGYDVSVSSSISEGNVPLALRSHHSVATEPRLRYGQTPPWSNNSANLALSCPTIMGHWNYSEIYKKPAFTVVSQSLNPGVGPHQRIDFAAILAAGKPEEAPAPAPPPPAELASSNTSTYPLVGSSNSTWLFQNCGSSALSVCPVYGRGNGSLSGQRDSCETSANHSDLTTAASSQNTTGYNAGPSHSTSMSISNSNQGQEMSLRGISAIGKSMPHDESGINSGSREHFGSTASSRPRQGYNSTEGLGTSCSLAPTYPSGSLKKMTPLALAAMKSVANNESPTWEVYPFFGAAAPPEPHQGQLDYCQRWRYRQPPVLDQKQHWV